MIPATYDRQLEWEFIDDFYKLDTVQWTSVDDGATGTNLLNNANGGTVSVVTAGANNDYHTMISASKPFKFLTNKNFYFESKINLTEAATNVASWIVGFSDTTTTGGLQSGTSGPLASFTGAIFYKISGTQTIKFMHSAGSTQTISTITWPFTSGTDYVLSFEFSKLDGTTGQLVPRVNGVVGTPINVTIASMAFMYGLYGLKAGSSSAETLVIDYFYARGQR